MFMSLKKILIVSDEEDNSTNEVIDWIHYYEKPFIRINETDEIELIDLTIFGNAVDFTLLIANTNTIFKLSEIGSYWYRRGDINLSKPFKNLMKELPSSLRKKIEGYYEWEHRFLYQFIHRIIVDYVPISLNCKFDNFTNKLYNIWTASKNGLLTPDTLICASKDTLKTFLSHHKDIITKAIGFNYVPFDDGKIILKTNIVSNENLNDFSLPTLFQNYEDKVFELRIFFIHDEFYPSAIFSQCDPKTFIDFRNYNHEKPNRIEPIALPKEIEYKLSKTMNDLKINSGSIDMIVNKENQYVFLEVNPIGQFKQISLPLNYQLEKKIAKYLCSY